MYILLRPPGSGVWRRTLNQRIGLHHYIHCQACRTAIACGSMRTGFHGKPGRARIRPPVHRQALIGIVYTGRGIFSILAYKDSKFNPKNAMPSQALIALCGHALPIFPSLNQKKPAPRKRGAGPLIPGYATTTARHCGQRPQRCSQLPGCKKRLVMVPRARKARPQQTAFGRSGLAGAAQHVHQFVPNQFFDVGPSGLQILSGIKFIGMLAEKFPNGSRHSQAQI